MAERHQHDRHGEAEREVHDGLPSHGHRAITAHARLRRLAEQQIEAPFAKDVIRLLAERDAGHCVHCWQQGFDEGAAFTATPELTDD